MVLTHVERVLRDCCAPGAHDYGAGQTSDTHAQCRCCGRRERTDGGTCLLCEADGALEALLAHASGDAVMEGVLCRECHRELSFRGEVLGWRAVPASAVA